MFITGTHWNWEKRVNPMEKTENGFLFSLKLTPYNMKKPFFFKFLVDGKWMISPHFPKHIDKEGNENNFLSFEDYVLAGIISDNHNWNWNCSEILISLRRLISLPLQDNVESTLTWIENYCFSLCQYYAVYKNIRMHLTLYAFKAFWQSKKF